MTVFKENKKVIKNKKTKGYTFQYYNQFCACVIRIRETIGYLEQFIFKKDNMCKQAFDFYEFINFVFSVEHILKTIKWLFIEQDIRYWNYSGRQMTWGVVPKLD